MPLLASQIPDLGPTLVRAERDSQERRRKLSQRLRIDREDYDADKLTHLRKVYRQADPSVIVGLSAFLGDSPNLLQRVIDKISTAYKIPPVRGLGQTLSRRYLDLTREAGLDRLLRRVSREAYLVGRVWVVPVIRGAGVDARLGWVTIGAQRVIKVWHGSDDHNPDVIAYSSAEDEGGAYRVLDAEGWRTYDGHGQLIGRTPSPAPGVRLHVLFSPWAGTTTQDDYWQTTRHAKLVSATLEAARVWAAMSYVRSQQNRKLLTLVTDDAENIPDGQVTEPHDALVVHSEAGATEISTVDFDTPVTNFRAELRLHVEAAVEPYGLPSSAIDPDESSTDTANTSDRAAGRQHRTLAEIRDSQIDYLRDAERELAVSMAYVAAAMGRPFARPEQVRRQFTISFAPLAFADHPLVRQQIITGWIKLGLMDQVTAYQQEHPGTTVEEAEAAVMLHAERRARINDFQASRNIPADPADDNAPLPERQGRIGGQVSDTEDDD